MEGKLNSIDKIAKIETMKCHFGNNPRIQNKKTIIYPMTKYIGLICEYKWCVI